VLITVGQWVDVWVVEQRLLAIAPWEALVTFAKVVHLDEGWTRRSGMFLVLQVGVQGADQYTGNGHKEGEPFPQFVTAAWEGEITLDGLVGSQTGLSCYLSDRWRWCHTHTNSKGVMASMRLVRDQQNSYGLRVIFTDFINLHR
jgi:hypothetical protein